ncbi:MAG: helix-turn-helix transcriptional regulator [Thermomicrobiales bacterium]
MTTREREIALLIVQGADIPEIAKRLFLAPTTVQWHLANAPKDWQTEEAG